MKFTHLILSFSKHGYVVQTPKMGRAQNNWVSFVQKHFSLLQITICQMPKENSYIVGSFWGTNSGSLWTTNQQFLRDSKLNLYDPAKPQTMHLEKPRR